MDDLDKRTTTTNERRDGATLSLGEPLGFTKRVIAERPSNGVTIFDLPSESGTPTGSQRWATLCATNRKDLGDCAFFTLEVDEGPYIARWIPARQYYELMRWCGESERALDRADEIVGRHCSLSRQEPTPA